MSRLMQYLDMPLSALLRRMQKLPTHLILYKVAVRDGETVVTLERIGKSHLSYQIRAEGAFIGDVQALDYSMVDRWTIPPLSHIIETHRKRSKHRRRLLLPPWLRGWLGGHLAPPFVSLPSYQRGFSETSRLMRFSFSSAS
ncbi:hypothetical protein AB4Z52_06440 [Rhizobium sp. 2YAF20]|uniref:hypothetical protein n=1 Tax=Rhizobium sp. 2YAF20 TaxID=3233027 RepID=UPI003F944F10